MQLRVNGRNVTACAEGAAAAEAQGKPDLPSLAQCRAGPCRSLRGLARAGSVLGGHQACAPLCHRAPSPPAGGGLPGLRGRARFCTLGNTWTNGDVGERGQAPGLRGLVGDMGANRLVQLPALDPSMLSAQHCRLLVESLSQAWSAGEARLRSWATKAICHRVPLQHGLPGPPSPLQWRRSCRWVLSPRAWQTPAPSSAPGEQS